MEQVHSGSRIASKSQDHLSVPHEEAHMRVDSRESHRGLLNEKADQSRHSNADDYQYTGPFMNKSSSRMLIKNGRAF